MWLDSRVYFKLTRPRWEKRRDPSLRRSLQRIDISSKSDSLAARQLSIHLRGRLSVSPFALGRKRRPSRLCGISRCRAFHTTPRRAARTTAHTTAHHAAHTGSSGRIMQVSVDLIVRD